MEVKLRDTDDQRRLEELVRVEHNAKQRDRYRAALLAVAGWQTPRIVAALGRSRRFVQSWAYAYRDGGIDGLLPARSTGRPTKLPRELEQAFRQRVLAGPIGGIDPGVCSLRGEDTRRILEQEFGARYTLQGVYDLLDRLGLSCLSPRPRHRKNDPAAMRQWLDSAPFLSGR
jgi:transposase